MIGTLQDRCVLLSVNSPPYIERARQCPPHSSTEYSCPPYASSTRCRGRPSSSTTWSCCRRIDALAMIDRAGQGAQAPRQVVLGRDRSQGTQTLQHTPSIVSVRPRLVQVGNSALSPRLSCELRRGEDRRRTRLHPEETRWAWCAVRDGRARRSRAAAERRPSSLIARPLALERRPDDEDCAVEISTSRASSACQGMYRKVWWRDLVRRVVA